MLLAFDPGETTGWASFSEQGEPTGNGQVSIVELIDLVERFKESEEPISIIIYEDFKLYKHKASRQVGSRMPASQAIGIIRTLIRVTGAKEVTQMSDILSTAQKWTQVFPPGAHADSHRYDAYNHGMYYLIKEGRAKTALERKHDAMRKSKLQATD